MNGLRFLAGTPGFPSELALAAEGSGDEECMEWLGRWWEWEQRWRGAVSAALRLPPPAWLCSCWEARTSEGVASAFRCLEWHWLSGKAAKRPGAHLQRLGTLRLGEKPYAKPCLQLCLAVGALPIEGKAPSFAVVHRLCRKAGHGVFLGQPAQTYFFSTCLLDRK